MMMKVRLEEKKKVVNKNERKRKYLVEILLLIKLVRFHYKFTKKRLLIINYFDLDVDEDEDDSDEVDEPEEGFVETDLLDTTPADIYRAGRSKFPIAEEFVSFFYSF